MSKSYNIRNRYKRRDLDGVVEYPNGYVGYGKVFEPGKEYDSRDRSYTTMNQEVDVTRLLSRHPNKRKHRTGTKWIKTRYNRTTYINKQIEDE